MNRRGQGEKKSTLKDVAQKVGMSVATVSMALNQSAGYERISAETRKMILAAAEELNYQPHYMAQALKKRNTKLVALAVPNIYHPFTPQLIGGVQDALRENGYHLLLLDLTNSPDTESVRTVLQLESGGIDGLIVHSMSGELGPVAEGKLPIVYLDEKSVSPAVWFDADGATRTLTRHFLEQGIRRIGYVGSTMTPETYTQRERGYRSALEEAGAPVDESLICHVSPQLKGLRLVPEPEGQARGPGGLHRQRRPLDDAPAHPLRGPHPRGSGPGQRGRRGALRPDESPADLRLGPRL